MSSFYLLKKYTGGYQIKSAVWRRALMTWSVLVLAVLPAIHSCRLPAAVVTAVWLAAGIIIFLFSPVPNKTESLDEVERLIYRKRALAIWIAESTFMWVLCSFGLANEGEGILFSHGFIAVSMLMEQIGLTGKKKREDK